MAHRSAAHRSAAQRMGLELQLQADLVLLADPMGACLSLMTQTHTNTQAERLRQSARSHARGVCRAAAARLREGKIRLACKSF
jgi:prephenate dehydrogenase